MKIQFAKITQINSGLWLVVFALLLASPSARAQTVVSGNISGTWTPAGNPYIVVDDCTVPLGQTLTIQPGVVVWIGSNVTVTANGSIYAVGTPGQRISIQSPTPSQYWSNIVVNYNGGTSRFDYCDFRNGYRALYLRVYNVDAAMHTEVVNCTFSNCPDAAVYGESEGAFVGCPYNCTGTHPVLDPLIKNCVFADCGDACRFRVFGNSYVTCCPGFLHVGPGGASPRIIGNIFLNISGTALNLTTGPNSSSSPVEFNNNTLVNCRVGVDTQDPWDAGVQSSIFAGCSNAVMRSGSLSGIVGYNDFYQNATNFTGYPATYGSPIIVNRNGTSSDLVFNIFQNPLFVAANDFHLSASSTCIDAGVGDPANFDSCFPPSLGSVTNDIGAYGGPNGCEWIAPPSTNIFTVALAQYYGVTINPPTNGHYRLEYTPAVGNTNDWTQLTNLTLSTTPFTYYDPVAFGPRFYRAVLLP